MEEKLESSQEYNLALEEVLHKVVNESIISIILKFNRQNQLITESIKKNLSPKQSHYDIDDIDSIGDIFSDWEDFQMELQNFVEKIQDAHTDVSEKIHHLVCEWEYVLKENPDATELPSPPKNYPHKYKSDLFGNDPE
ncbi:MAG: hypothetical protein AAFY41_18740 [Bacteroidota bacterium]